MQEKWTVQELEKRIEHLDRMLADLKAALRPASQGGGMVDGHVTLTPTLDDPNGFRKYYRSC